LHASAAEADARAPRCVQTPIGIFDRCEEKFDADFGEIPAEKLADPSAAWPAPVASAVRDLVRSAKDVGLCVQSSRKRIGLPLVLEALTELLKDGGATGEAARRAAPADAPAASYVPSAPSVAARRIGQAVAGSAADRRRRLQSNASLAFRDAVRRLDAVYVARAVEAPADFAARIEFWRHECGLSDRAHDRMQQLRIWRNASEHHDEARWDREGPRSEDAFVALVKAVDEDLARLEKG